VPTPEAHPVKPSITEILFGIPQPTDARPIPRPAEDLSYRYGNFIWEKDGDLFYYTGSGGTKLLTVPEGYNGRVVLQIEINTNSKHSMTTTTVDNNPPVSIMGQGTPWDGYLSPGTHTVKVELDQPGGCTMVLRHYP
jgi:hypothetical protein